MAPTKKFSLQKKEPLKESDPEYLGKRNRNNAAVRKSREKNRMIIAALRTKMDILFNDNEEMGQEIEGHENNVDTLSTTVAGKIGSTPDELEEMLKGYENMSEEDAVNMILEKIAQRERGTR